jgi:uncharacterized membrane protein
VPPPFTGPGAAAGVPSNWASVLCYIVPIVGPLIFLFLAPYNADRKVRFDAWQGLFLQIAFIGAEIVAGIFYSINWHVGNLVTRLVNLAWLVAIVILAVNAYQGKKYVLPVIGPMAEKQK